ncbi:hypothetical protein [Burkholderia pseudomallei]|uniref:hypothetical protein n=1 Tax=Burkholderia pseudomallei TaxID=28450 RepID=UPI0016544BAC|nr:hypothetical protein [Burkholderia pseudomallei]
MNVLRLLLAMLGALTVVLYLLGASGIGHFHLYFGAEPLVCTVRAEPPSGVSL